MSALSYHEIKETLNLLAEGGPKHGYRVVKVAEDDSTWLSTWATDDIYVAVLASPFQDIGATLIDVHAGGAYGARSDGGLFQALAVSSGRWDFGGPWARVGPDATVAYGWRLRLPGLLLTHETRSDAFKMLLDFVDGFGGCASALANELIPEFGGKDIADKDPNAWPALLSGLIPAQ